MPDDAFDESEREWPRGLSCSGFTFAAWSYAEIGPFASTKEVRFVPAKNVQGESSWKTVKRIAMKE